MPGCLAPGTRDPASDTGTAGEAVGSYARWGGAVASDFIRLATTAANESAAVEHPYLTALRNGDLPDLKRALKDFALQYGLYSARFPDYVAAVAAVVDRDEHRQVLLSNLAEELAEEAAEASGEPHDEALSPELADAAAGQPHALLYRRFQEALGVVSSASSASSQNGVTATPLVGPPFGPPVGPGVDPGLAWSEQFLDLCKADAYAGIGAIGLGTELIVPRIYRQILDGLMAHTDLTMAQRVFFHLHAACDERHAEQLLSITAELATDGEACERIGSGMREALDLRARFWDRMMARAYSLRSDDSPRHDERLPGVGYRDSL